MIIKFSFHAAAARLSMTKSELEEYLEWLSIYECSNELPCPKFFVQEGYFIGAEENDEQVGQLTRLFFTDKGVNAFEKLLLKEMING